jgi:hypothetical protein
LEASTLSPDPTEPDLAQLRQRWPNWRIEVSWVSSTSRPDVRTLHATDGLRTIVAYSEASLDAQIEQTERGT